ncbi:glycoside hydrolase family 15 protein [Mycolicibacterium komossense]|uniref:Glycoside hydrolase family 15 protein n=1 Tax=Mycolicibacterium komossense TaxID=1779 RepID=A0ABT3CJ88_9MYCO|nr:glycoside hydrolase family 15 protein [Mycolicibacterium komossense]MCV7229554.1 glycoside hydrolase family 15 protein [Mycolicibacterium komossense]
MARIEDYALLGDLQTAALVSTTGSIDWLCFPRFDSPACFAALLDTPDAGHWSLAPTSGHTCTSRRYVDDTLVLESEWATPDGTVRVIDFMPPRGHSPDVVRIVEGVNGTVPMRSDLKLRFEYGRVVPWVRHHGDRVEALAGPNRVRLRTPAPTKGHEMSTVSEFTVRAGDRVPFVLTWSQSHQPSPKPVDAEHALRDTLAFWTDWSRHGNPVRGPYRNAIKRSLIILKALTYEPTGGIVAAATTSLPEQIGGSRNWDYRYCWLRDSTYTLQALISAGYLTEAKAWREWLLRAVAGQPDDLKIMYALDGTRYIPESELPWLAGYESSQPVRTGNAASDQLQLDVWGETLDGLALARNAGIARRDDAWDLQVALMNHLEGVWDQPDNGLWEMRGARRHFTHSKVLAWVGANRMAAAVRTHPELSGPADRWEALADTIHADVLAHGYDADRNTFTQSYDAPGLDAALLMIPRVGFLPPKDSRVLGTIAAIQNELTEGGLVKRYNTSDSDDGLSGGEGLFLACSFWLVDALHLAGHQAEATALFERLLTLRNDVGLLSEEWDPGAGRQLGNTPQAFSHFPLVTSALQLHAGRGHHSNHPIAASEAPPA